MTPFSTMSIRLPGSMTRTMPRSGRILWYFRKSAHPTLRHSSQAAVASQPLRLRLDTQTRMDLASQYS